jgi:MoxR-like ATPase
MTMKLHLNDQSDDRTLLEQTGRIREALIAEIDNRIVGQKIVVEHMLVSLLAGGHALLVGVPGLAKTLLVRTLSDALNLSFGRIQFTPDLMPADITGTDILEDGPDGRRFRFLKGPVFCNLLLADEINRTPPKTQAALLQAMAEGNVTAGGATWELPRPFIVFATQNPIEQTGTYPLPEAQRDRFMLQIDVGYPALDEEIEIVKRTTAGAQTPLSRVIDEEGIRVLQAFIPRVPVADHVIQTAVRLVRASRPAEPGSAETIRRNVAWGAGPRTAQMLILAAKARAVLHGRMAAEREDVLALLPAVMRHRLVLNFEAEARGIKPDTIIAHLIEQHST